jgi:hypothetical protein
MAFEMAAAFASLKREFWQWQAGNGDVTADHGQWHGGAAIDIGHARSLRPPISGRVRRAR